MEQRQIVEDDTGEVSQTKVAMFALTTSKFQKFYEHFFWNDDQMIFFSSSFIPIVVTNKQTSKSEKAKTHRMQANIKLKHI